MIGGVKFHNTLVFYYFCLTGYAEKRIKPIIVIVVEDAFFYE